MADELEQMDVDLVGDVPGGPVCDMGQHVVQRPVSVVACEGRTLFKVHGDNVKNALLIDETGDAATPFEGSLVARQLFPNSVLLAEPGGTSHADSLAGDLCVDGTIAKYLETGRLPGRKPNAEWDKTCPPIPVPVPPSSPAGERRAVRCGSRARPTRQGGLPGRADRRPGLVVIRAVAAPVPDPVRDRSRSATPRGALHRPDD